MTTLKPEPIFSALMAQIGGNPPITEISHSPTDFVGQAAAAGIVIAGSTLPSAGLVVSASRSLFEGPTRRSSSGVWNGAEVRGEDVGVRAATSSLVDGFRAYVHYSSQYSNHIYEECVIEGLEPDDNGFLIGDSATALLYPADSGNSWDIHVFAQNTGLELNSTDEKYFFHNVSKARITLNGVYRDISVNDVVLVEYEGQVMASPVTQAKLVHRVITAPNTPVEDQVKIPVTQIVIQAATKIGQPEDMAAVRIWFNARKAGTLERIPTKTVQLEDMLDTPRPITLRTPASLPINHADVIIEDAEGTALIAKGNIYTEPESATTYVEITNIPEQGFEGELVKPITFHWGLTTVTRGETVKREVLGSGDAGSSFQTFTLAKSPLTYVADATAAGGRRPEIEVYVDGLKWTRAQSFYGATPTDQIYVLQHDAKHATHVVFGDGDLGSRLPTGFNNVVARYRHGVGGNVDAREITRLTRPIKGVTSVVNPLPASGGEDLPTPEQARARAIMSTRVLGKLVALPDFEVEAARWGGVLQAKAHWAWDQSSDDALVKLWIVAPGPGDPSADLQGYLQALAEPSTRVRVHKASALAFNISFELVADPRHVHADVYTAVHTRLFDSETGFFAPRNAILGAVFLRSQLYAAIHEVPGVDSVRVVTFYGEVPAGYKVPEGKYLAPTFISLDPNFQP